ncbi:MAG: AsmA family protein, partial [Acidobacteria bacterium]
MRRKVLLGLLGLLLTGFAGLILYLKYADHRGAVEDLVSDALGRRLTIAGKLEMEVGRITHVVATDVILANPAWSDRPAMVHMDRLEGSIALWSLFRGPVRLGDVRIEGARVLLEADGEGRANWQFDPAGDH